MVTLAVSNDIEPGKEFYTANPAANAIVLDGDLGDWSGVPVLSDPRFSIPKGSGREGELVLFEIYNGGDWTGPDDHTSAVQIAWDMNNVYFGFVVTDEYHENSANSAWNGDSVQLMIANDKQDSQVALYNYALGGVEGDLGEVIVMHEAGPGGTEAVVVRNSEIQRTTYEIKLPAESLGLVGPLDFGMMFGLGMAINDGDEATPGQKGWGGLGAHSIVFGKTPSETALVTLGKGPTGIDRIFFSAISPSLEGFAFRANDKNESIVDPATVKLFIDGQEVELTASTKKFDAIDFTHTFPGPFESNSEHTFRIEMQDFNGNSVSESGTFRSPLFSRLLPCMMATEVDTSQPGFLWRVIQNDFAPVTNLAETELLLAGQLPDAFGAPIAENFAYNDGFFGPAIGAGVMDGLLLEFEIPTVINLSAAGEFAIVGNFDPKEQMPGVPGNFFGIDGAAAEIITFIEFPAGVTTMGINSDDGFRTEGGFIDDPEHRELMGEFPATRAAADGTFLVSVDEAGIYPVRTIWWNSTNQDASIEIFTVMEDGTKVLVNDTENGGLKAYRSGVVPAFDPECAPAPVLTGPVVNFRLDGDHNSSTEFGSGSLMGGIPGTPGPLPALVGGVTGEAGDQAAEFTGNGSNVAFFEDADAAMNFDDQDYTMEAWVKIGSPNAAGDGNSKGIIAAYGLPGGYSMWITAEGTIGGTTYGIVDLFTEAVVPADGWHHVAEVHESGAEVRFYIDGALAHTLAETRGVNPSDDHTLYVGYERASADPINPFNGLIDRVRVTPKALTPDELDLTPGPSVIPALGLDIGLDVDGNIVLNFEGDLMEADNVDGPYSRVDGAASPMTIAPEGSRKFYQSSN